MSKKMTCPYCNKRIMAGEPKVKEGDEWYHLSCAVEEADGNDLNNELGD